MTRTIKTSFLVIFGVIICYCCIRNFSILLHLDYYSQDGTHTDSSIITDDEFIDANPESNSSESVPNVITTARQSTDLEIILSPQEKKAHQESPEYDYATQHTLSTKPFDNVTTAAYQFHFWSGFCNQYMMFLGVIILAKEEKYSQILVEPLKWKDLFGTNQMIQHDKLFDVVHWNSFYPELPRIVSHDADVLPDLSIVPGKNSVSSFIIWKTNLANTTKPYRLAKRATSAIHAYTVNDRKVATNRKKRDKFEVEIMRDAFRPHPELQSIIDDFLQPIGKSYMVLHARIEPDMQKHGACGDRKVTAFKDIIRMLKDQFKEEPPPHVNTIIVILNREILEKEVASASPGKKKNTLAVENLEVLNDLVANGLWDGRVNVIEAGSNLAIASGHEIYSKYYAISGGIINYFISIKAAFFVGTEVSSYSSAVVKSRFFREALNNYFYVPQGLKLVTPVNATAPPKFSC